ncbi:putative maltase-glucoamylase 2, partial [Bienertia sinuspersici]
MIFNVYSGNDLIIGDLNQLDNSNQNLGGRKRIPLGRWFKNWTINHNLNEIPYKGANYTWTNNREGESLVQEWLDRAYGKSDWKDIYPNTNIWNFPIFISDHGPIALDTNPILIRRKRPYRLEAWCYKKEEIEDIITKSLDQNIQGSKMFILQRRLQIIRSQCMKWCLNHQKDIGINWARYKDELHEDMSEDPVKDANEKQKDYWRQRAKSKWNDWGDKSTGFFFRSVETRATKNEIRAIKNEENHWLTNDQNIKNAFHKYFSELLNPTLIEDI